MKKRTIGMAVFCVMFQLLVIRTASHQEWVWKVLDGMELAAALVVLVVSFSVTAFTVYRADQIVDEEELAPGRKRGEKRDVEAYIDQMLAANGTHLNRHG